MKAMAFDSTTRAILEQTKRCTRRAAGHAVSSLRPGDLLRAVNRRQNLRPGEQARTLAVLRVEDMRLAPPLSPEEVELEGYAGKSVAFVHQILRNMYGNRPLLRVQFHYVALAAPRIVAMGTDWREVRTELDLAWRGTLQTLPRGDPRRRELRELQRLGRSEILVTPTRYSEICSSLNLDALDLWREPGAPERARRRSRRSNQLTLF